MNNPKINSKNLLYLTILVVIAAGLAIITYLTIKFLTYNINASFDIDKSVLEASAIKVNKEDYKLAAKKLNIPYPNKNPNPIESPPIISPTPLPV